MQPRNVAQLGLKLLLLNFVIYLCNILEGDFAFSFFSIDLYYDISILVAAVEGYVWSLSCCSGPSVGKAYI